MKKCYPIPVGILLIFIIPLIAGCNVNCINASGEQVSEMRNLGPFKKIDVGGAMEVYLKQGPTSSVSLEADKNIMRHLKTEVRGETLSISHDFNICNSGTIRAYITSPNFEEIEASGAVKLANGGVLKGEKLLLDVSGASKLELSVEVGTLETDASGASKIALKGKASSHRVDVSGACKINAFDLVVGKYSIETSGASKLEVNALNTLDVSSSGASKIDYKGNPSSISNDKSGASSLTKVD